jgi:uncharacterized LabA/DUF88 family protein
MAKKQQTNFAFIDSQNVNLSIRSAGWKLDFARFRIYLLEKYAVEKAFLFLGYVDGNQDMYTRLQEEGFILVFKPTLKYKDGTVKGNCDAELVLQAMIEYANYEGAVLVTGDGDFHCLVKYLLKKDKLKKIIIPNQKTYSALLKRFPSEYLAFMTDLRAKLEFLPKKKRTP